MLDVEALGLDGVPYSGQGSLFGRLMGMPVGLVVLRFETGEVGFWVVGFVFKCVSGIGLWFEVGMTAGGGLLAGIVVDGATGCWIGAGARLQAMIGCPCIIQ